jgi:hypothetical protein
MYADVYVNNAVRDGIMPHPQIRTAHNKTGIPPKALNPSSFRKFRSGPGGMVVPGLTGDKPGIGAYDESDPNWRAGHDFENPPNPAYRLADTPLRNIVRHGSFDGAQWRGKLGPWEPTGAGTAKIIVGKPSGIVNCYTGRDSIIGAAVELSGEKDAGVEQTVDGLWPKQVYEVSAWVKVRGNARVAIGVRGGKTVLARAKAERPSRWRLLTARFTTSDKPRPATVFVTKSGGGTAFVDHVAVAGVVKGIEPVKPGFAR